MKEIILNHPIAFKELLKSYNQSIDSLVCVKIGYDEKLYILLSSHIPERINGMFVDTKADSHYSAIIMDVDWYEGMIIGHRLVDLGFHKMNFHMIQPIKDNILLLGARCHYHVAGGPEMNAVIVDLQGNRIKEFCLGDGIEDCIVTKDGNIITSYFDEGIFGNYGWDKPVGHCGLIVWTGNGEILWEASRDIYDCYAMNLDDHDSLWYYYYDAFDLVKTDLHEETVYTPEISGSSGFLITSDSKKILFDGGYDKHGTFQMASFDGGNLKDYETVQLSYEGKYLLTRYFSFMRSNAVFIDSDNRLFVRWFPS